MNDKELFELAADRAELQPFSGSLAVAEWLRAVARQLEAENIFSLAEALGLVVIEDTGYTVNGHKFQRKEDVLAYLQGYKSAKNI